MLNVTTILILMYWGGDGRSAMTSHQFNSMETCEAARVAIKKEMDGWALSKTYSVCVRK